MAIRGWRSVSRYSASRRLVNPPLNSELQDDTRISEVRALMSHNYARRSVQFEIRSDAIRRICFMPIAGLPKLHLRFNAASFGNDVRNTPRRNGIDAFAPVPSRHMTMCRSTISSLYVNMFI